MGEDMKNRIIKEFSNLKNTAIRYANLTRKKMDLKESTKELDFLYAKLGKNIFNKQAIPGSTNNYKEDLKSINDKNIEILAIEEEINRLKKLNY
jgi:hypothetical protein